MRRSFTIIILIFSVASNIVYSQSDTLNSPQMSITMKDGKHLIGKITSSGKGYLNFLTRENQLVQLAKDSIDQIIRVEEMSNAIQESETDSFIKDTTANFEVEDQQLSRMVIFPTARSLRSGQAYFQVNEFFFPFIAFGIADIITLGGGVSVLPTLKQQIFYVSPKVTVFNYEKFYLAGGIFYSNSLFDKYNSNFIENGFGISYAMGTYGDKDKSFSLGLGYGFSGNDYSNKPVVIIGGDVRTYKGLKLIVEAWFPPNSKFILGMFGFRAVGKRFSGDAVLMRIYGSNSNNANFIPWFNITYNFDLYD